MQTPAFSGGSTSTKKGIWDRVLKGEFEFWILAGRLPDVRLGQIAVRLRFNRSELIIPPDQLAAIADLIAAQVVGNPLSCIGFNSVHQVME